MNPSRRNNQRFTRTQLDLKITRKKRWHVKSNTLNALVVVVVVVVDKLQLQSLGITLVKVFDGNKSGKKVDESKVKSLKAFRTAVDGGANKKILRPNTK